MGLQGLPVRNGINRVMRVSRRGSTKGCLIAALVVFALLLAAGGVGAYVVVKNGRSWVAAGMEAGMVRAVNQADLPDSEKDQVKQIVAGLRTDFENKVITLHDFEKIVEGFQSSPLIAATVASQSYKQYYDANPDLTDQDKADAKLQLGRLARGVFDNSLKNADLVAALEPITAPAGTPNTGIKVELNGVQIELKRPEQCSVVELRQVTANATKTCDDAAIPSEPFVVDVSDELNKIINTALGRTGPGGTDTVLNTAPTNPDDAAAQTDTNAVGDAPTPPETPDQPTTDEPTSDDGP